MGREGEGIWKYWKDKILEMLIRIKINKIINNNNNNYMGINSKCNNNSN
jgi:hypothetical protein